MSNDQNKDDRFAISGMAIDRIPGTLFGFRFTPWGALSLDIGVDAATKKPGEKWQRKGAGYFVNVLLPKGHEAERLLESGELKVRDKDTGELGRIFLSNGGMFAHMDEWERDGVKKQKLAVTGAKWTLVSSDPKKRAERKKTDPEVVDSLPEESPF